MREVLRDVLAELLPELVAEARAPQRAAPQGAVPTTPPPPVAAVHRPSTWHGSAATPAPSGAGVEQVSLASDAELQAFVQLLAKRCESEQERAALRSGAHRFALRRGTGGTSAAAAAGARRIDQGAVTERMVREAKAAGSALLLGPKAVLTPLARDVARTLGVTIEKEKRC